MCQTHKYSNLIFPTDHADYRQQIIDLADAYCNQDTITVYTSGSTGKPKKIDIPKSHIHNSTLVTAHFFGLDFNSSMLLALSPTYIAGKMMLFRALEYNCKLTCIEAQNDPLDPLSPDEKFDFVALVPKQLEAIYERSPERLHQFKTILIGGAPINKEFERKIAALHDQVYISFGMTETVSHCAIRKLGSPYYKAVENVSFAVNDSQELIVKAPDLSGRTSLQTHDVVKLISHQEFEWLGRSDFVINSGGHKIHPEKIEAQIKHLFDGDIIAVGQPDVTLGEKLIVLSESSVNTSIRNEIKDILHPYEVPKSYIEVPKIMRNANNKIDRNANKAIYLDET